MICFQISIFEPLKTASIIPYTTPNLLWFAFKLVSLNHWKQLTEGLEYTLSVVICFQISIFEPLKTASDENTHVYRWLWFAFKLVSLNHWKQLYIKYNNNQYVVICFQISIFEPLKTAITNIWSKRKPLWFAFKLVSLNHWKQQRADEMMKRMSCDLLSN